jgi:hypothetical protein
MVRRPQEGKYPQPLASAPHASKSVLGSLNVRRALSFDLKSQLSVSLVLDAAPYD